MTLRLRPDMVLVKLPPAKNAQKVELITTDLYTFLAHRGIDEFQRLLPLPKPEKPWGIVQQVGRATHDVWPGDVVVLEPEAGQELDIPDDLTGWPWPHVLVRELDIQAVIERTA